jgi:hypothetical protein
MQSLECLFYLISTFLYKTIFNVECIVFQDKCKGLSSCNKPVAISVEDNSLSVMQI